MDAIYAMFGQAVQIAERERLLMPVNGRLEEPLYVKPNNPEIYQLQHEAYVNNVPVDFEYMHRVNPGFADTMSEAVRMQIELYKAENPLKVGAATFFAGLMQRFPAYAQFFRIFMQGDGNIADMRAWQASKMRELFSAANWAQGDFYYYDRDYNLDFKRNPERRPLFVFEMISECIKSNVSQMVLAGKHDELTGKLGFTYQGTPPTPKYKSFNAMEAVTDFTKQLAEFTQSLGSHRGDKLNPGELSQDLQKLVKKIGENQRNDFEDNRLDPFWCVEPDEGGVLSMAISCVYVHVHIKDFKRCCECHHELLVEIKHYSKVYKGKTGGVKMVEDAKAMGVSDAQILEWGKHGQAAAA